MSGCESWTQYANPVCYMQKGVEAVVGSAVENLASAVMEAFGRCVASLGTLWVNVGTPDLTGAGGSSPVRAGEPSPGSAGVTTVLGYVTWVSLVVAVVSLVGLGMVVAVRMRRGEGLAAAGRLGLVLGAAVLVSSASALVSGLMPSAPSAAGGATLFLQSSLWWYMGAAAIASVVVGGARMAWEQRAEPGRQVLRGLMTLVVVAGAGTTVVSLLVAAADGFSLWVLSGSLACDVGADSACFGESLTRLLALGTLPGTAQMGALMVILLGLAAVIASVVQIMLMVARGGMLVVLAGVLPLAASLTTTEAGRTWFRRCVAWIVAFVLYKPAAAVVYAAAFQLVGTPAFSDDGTGVLEVLSGLMLMVLALFALPALLRFVTPMVGAAAGGGGGALAVGAMAAAPTGAMAVGRLASGSGSGPGAGGPEGASGPQGPSGGRGGGTTTQQAGPRHAGAGSPGGGSGSGAGAQGADVSATSAGSGGAAAGGGAAASGAAGGPVGAVAGVAVQIGRKGVQVARSLGEQSVGEEGGPDGSR